MRPWEVVSSPGGVTFTPETQELYEGNLLPLTPFSIFEHQLGEVTLRQGCLNTSTCELPEGRGCLSLALSQRGQGIMGLSGFRAIIGTFSVQTGFPPFPPLLYPPFLPSLRGTAKVTQGSDRTNDHLLP